MGLHLNKLQGIIEGQLHSSGITRIEVMSEGYLFRLLVFEEQPKNRLGKTVFLVIKESEIAISKIKPIDISISNKPECIVSKIVCGDMLAQIYLQIGTETISSIITSESLHRLGIAEGERVYALIKANEIYLENTVD